MENVSCPKISTEVYNKHISRRHPNLLESKIFKDVEKRKKKKHQFLLPMGENFNLPLGYTDFFF